MRGIFRCDDPKLARLGGEEEGKAFMRKVPKTQGLPIAQADHWSASGGVLSSLANRFLSIDFS